MSLLSQERAFGQGLQEEARSKAEGVDQHGQAGVGALCGESEGGGDVYALFHINSATADGANKPLHTQVFLDDKELIMEVDTGASASLVSEETFKSLWKERVLQKSSARLQTLYRRLDQDRQVNGGDGQAQ